jgi:glucosamine-phosphate N-acetyltransferase
VQKKKKYSFLLSELKGEDLDLGFLETLDNLISGTSQLDRSTAESIVKEIETNPFHRIFIVYAIREDNKDGGDGTDAKKVVVGTTTLLVEPKFIFGGGRVGHIEDVCVRKEFQGLGLGGWLVNHATMVAESMMGCIKIVLDCSDETMPFYESLGYSYQDNCMVKKKF